MNSTDPNEGAEPALRPGETTWHPAWCLGEDVDEVHESRRYRIRERDSMQVELYLAEYAFGPLVAVDITVEVETTLIEFTLGEAGLLHEVLGGLLVKARAA